MRAARVLVLASDPRVYTDPIRDRFPNVPLARAKSYVELADLVRDFRPSVVLASKVGLPFPRRTLLDAPTVEWIQTTSAGIDHLLPLNRRVLVTSASGIHDEVLSDYVVAAVLLWNLHFPLFFRQQRKRIWSPKELVPAAGQALAVVGLGSIGTLAAQKAKKLGMRVLGVKKRPELRVDGVDEVRGVDALPDVAARADYLAVTLPLTPDTRGLVGGKILQAMKPGSVLVNLSRGGIIDEEALVAALTKGPLRGAVMDVFATEPLPAASALWGMDNLVITPHTGDVRDWQRGVVELFSANLERWVKRDPLRNLVDPDRGY